MTTYSLLIPTYRNEKYIMGFLKSFFEFNGEQYEKGEIEIIWVDNSINNRGFPGGINEGARRAVGDYLVIMNDDIEVRETEWLEKLRAKLNSTVVLAGRELQTGGDVKYIPLWCAMIHREVFLALEGLDEGFGLGLYDDVDFSRRIQENNWEIAAVEVDIHHYGSKTIEKFDGNEMMRQAKSYYEKKWSQSKK